MAGIATFNLSNQPNAGININGATQDANINPVQNTAPTSNQYLLQPSGGVVQDASTSAGGGTAFNPNTALINSQLAQLDPQQQIGLDNIGSSYNLSANRLDQQNAEAQRNYNTAGAQNTQSYLNTRNGVIQNTRATSNALQRLLGINGAGNSSAAYEQAPYAAALQGSQNLSGAQQTYGNNQSGLDTNWQDTERSYSNSKDDLNNQRYQQENALRSSIASTKAGLLGQLSNPDTNAISGLLAQITQLGQQYANPVLRTNDISFTAPSAAQYTLGSSGVNGTGQAGAANDINPTFLGLLGGQRDQYGNLIPAGA